MDIYREHILDHYRHPRHWGLTRHMRTHHGRNDWCGDVVTIQLDCDAGLIRRMRFEGTGCALSVAAASLLSEQVAGHTVTTVQRWGAPDMQRLLGITLPPARLSCGTLCLETLQKALPDYA
jgi:nitrogen fixation NifU-like protein